MSPSSSQSLPKKQTNVASRAIPGLNSLSTDNDTVTCPPHKDCSGRLDRIERLPLHLLSRKVINGSGQPVPHLRIVFHHLACLRQLFYSYLMPSEQEVAPSDFVVVSETNVSLPPSSLTSCSFRKSRTPSGSTPSPLPVPLRSSQSILEHGMQPRSSRGICFESLRSATCTQCSLLEQSIGTSVHSESCSQGSRRVLEQKELSQEPFRLVQRLQHRLAAKITRAASLRLVEKWTSEWAE